MTDPVNADWLRDEVVRLFRDASASGTPDHGACSAYANLLYRLLPKGTDNKGLRDEDLERIRRIVEEDRKKRAGANAGPA